MKHDPQKGGRYFLQLVVKDLMDETSNLEEYVFQPYDKNGYLCYPMELLFEQDSGCLPESHDQ